GDAAEDVAAADHQADLDAHPVHGLDVAGDTLHRFLIETVLLRSHQSFAGDLQEDAAIVCLQRHDGAFSLPIRHGVAPLPGCRMIHGFARPNKPAPRRHPGGTVAKSGAPGSGPARPHSLVRSMPSPSAMRTKPAILTGAPTSLAAFSTTVPTLLLASIVGDGGPE